MSDVYLIATGVLKSFLNNKDFFTYSYLKKCIMDEGGIMRIAANFPVNEYLKVLAKKGIITLKYTDDDIIINVLNLNYERKQKINKLKKLIK